MNIIEQLKKQADESGKKNGSGRLEAIRQDAVHAFNKWGIPTARHEEWKYTRIGGLFNKEYQSAQSLSIDVKDIHALRLPGHELANEMVFVNGIYAPNLSTIRSKDLVLQSLEDAANNEYRETVAKHLGHSSRYLKDGINALNTAFIGTGVFIHIKKGLVLDSPVYIYNVTDARNVNILAQPRILLHIGENAQVQIAETYLTIGSSDSLINQVMEVVVEKDAVLNYYKIQNDASNASQVSTTHIRQIGKSYTHTVTITLNGGIVRNNLNVVLEAPHCEAHLYGLYFQQGQTHVDNHTIVDNVSPNCFSNELYKGILKEKSTAVFNGKIFVQQPAQKTNAFQSNKNILLSPDASVNTKPQLEIFADDVKCSHGCTIGQLDEEGLFYLRSRGINENNARSLLVNAFAEDILEQVKLPALRAYVEKLVSERLEFEML